ncbi:lysozyme inhibitor LprI family protein [Bacillus sp. AK031]
MKRSKGLTTAALSVMLLAGLSACSNTADHSSSSNNQSVPANTSESTVAQTQATDQNSDEPMNENSNTKEGNQEQDETTTKMNEDSQEDKASKIEGRRTEFIEKLDHIQKELDAMPVKKDSDKGVTNAMKNYYGISYERYDKALNDIYALLQKELSPEAAKELKTAQIKWIEQKEAKANEERLKYEGGTFENVAYYISLYQSTKDKSYDLVNTYMTD